MTHPHEHHAAPHEHRQHTAPTAPVEPGYPGHPELARPPAGQDHRAHDKHAGHSVAMFRDRFWVSLALTIPTLVWGHMLPRAFGIHPPDVPGARWIPAVFGTLVFLYGGRPFIDGA